jgi:hypothetical protein
MDGPIPAILVGNPPRLVMPLAAALHAQADDTNLAPISAMPEVHKY